MVEIIAHPQNLGNKVEGIKLQPGDVIQKGDIYSCSSGSWNQAEALAGHQLKGILLVTWVRPLVQEKVKTA